MITEKVLCVPINDMVALETAVLFDAMVQRRDLMCFQSLTNRVLAPNGMSPLRVEVRSQLDSSSSTIFTYLDSTYKIQKSKTKNVQVIFHKQHQKLYQSYA